MTPRLGRVTCAPALALALAAALAASALSEATAAPGGVGCRWPDAGARAAIVAVASDRGSLASGVVIAPDRVLTVAHAVAGKSDAAGRAFVRVGEGYRVAELLLLDRTADLALLGVATYGIEPLPIAGRRPTDGEPVWAVGFPRTEGRTTSNGVFQRAGTGVLHTSAPIDAGQSGGALLGCADGVYHLLGVLRGYGAYRDGDAYVKLGNHSVSVAAETVRRALSAVP